jgi:hypothetical protein
MAARQSAAWLEFSCLYRAGYPALVYYLPTFFQEVEGQEECFGGVVAVRNGVTVALKLRGCVMVTKAFVMMVLATLAGPAVGIGVFVLLNAM